MNKKVEDKILKVVDQSLTKDIAVGNLVVQPNIPGSLKEWSKPLDAVTHGLAVTLKTGKKSSLRVKLKQDGADLTFTKKF